MMQPISFFAEGVPKGQPRPRAFSRGGHAAVYDPGTAEGWKGQIAIAAKPFLPPEPLSMPLSVRMDFYLPRPKAHYGSIQGVRFVKLSAPTFFTSKPDIDNFEKAVLDALTILRMWTDDAIVVELKARKLYDEGWGTGCRIEIREAL